MHRFHPLRILFFAGLFVAFATLASAVVMWLWNAILPDVTGVKPLNFWQAAGLLLLSKILFSGFGGKHRKSRGKPSRGKWKQQWMDMSPEERRETKARWKERCGKR